MLRVLPSRSLAVLVCALVVVGLSTPTVARPDVSTIARGLDNPRGLGFAPDGALYVAEAGRGGSGPCYQGPEGDEVCFGPSGAITRVANGRQSRVLTELPSTAARDGSFALGPTDVAFHDPSFSRIPLLPDLLGGLLLPDERRMFVTFGLGANPSIRQEVPQLRPMAQLVRGNPSRNRWSSIADIGEFEAKENPDGQELDTNPNSVFATPGGQAVVDAGGNALLWVSPDRRVETLAVFPDRSVDAPPFLGEPPGTEIPMDAVPTSVVRGPDGAFYVGELTGFPFPAGAARVYRVVPGQAPEVFAEGFTNIIDVAFDDEGRLYVLEITHNGLLSRDPTGALIRVNAEGSREVIMTEGLTFPGGLSIRGRDVYVSNCGTCPGTGSVLRLAVRP